MKKTLITMCLIAMAFGSFYSLSYASSTKSNSALAGVNVKKLTETTSKDGLSSKILDEALNADTYAYGHNEIGSNKDTLTVVDFTKPSYDRRLWVIDLKTDQVLMDIHVAHGKGSGVTYSTKFSNAIGTDASSLGLYITSTIYTGTDGESMRVIGDENGINNNAYRRVIVFHPAWYVTPSFLHKYGRLGRSWGCFAIYKGSLKQLYNDIKGGSVLFAYAPAEDHDLVADGSAES